MSFTKKGLFSEVFTVIDIGTYKVRLLQAKLDKDGVHLLSFGEKKQEEESFKLGEIYHIPSIYKSIKIGLEKIKTEEKSTAYIINLPASEVFTYSYQINHIRTNKNQEITEDEIQSILKDIEKRCYLKSVEDIYKKSHWEKESVKIIFSSIHSIQIDRVEKINPVGEKGENINISLTNIFMLESDVTKVTEMLDSLSITNYKIIPFEYAITKLFDTEDEIVVINIGNTKSYISIKKKKDLIFSTRIHIGIQDLIKKIQEAYDLTSIEVIKTLDTGKYEEEKNNFLTIFSDFIALGIKELIGKDICPKKFFITGGGGTNLFIQNFFKNFQFLDYGISTVQKTPDLVEIPEIEALQGFSSLQNLSNIDILSSLLAFKQYKERKNDYLTETLESIIENIEDL